MIPAGKVLIRTNELARELEVSEDTVARWGKSRLKAARYSRGIYLVAKLRAIGVLPQIEEPQQGMPPTPSTAALGGLVVVSVEELRRIVREEVARAVVS